MHNGGETGIRTPEPVAQLLPFQTMPFDNRYHLKPFPIPYGTGGFAGSLGFSITNKMRVVSKIVSNRVCV